MSSVKAADRAFPVVMKYGGLMGAVVATAAAFSGHDIGAPLLGLFGSMMGTGLIAEALRSQPGEETHAEP